MSPWFLLTPLILPLAWFLFMAAMAASEQIRYRLPSGRRYRRERHQRLQRRRPAGLPYLQDPIALHYEKLGMPVPDELKGRLVHPPKDRE